MPYLSCVGYADGERMQTRSADKGGCSGSWSDMGTARVDYVNDVNNESQCEDHIKAVMNMHTWNKCSADEARELGTDCVAGERGECECREL